MRALLVVADESEEMEVVITVDVLRRARVDVTVAGLDGAGAVACSRGVRLVPDVALSDVKADDPYDVLILPGGAGGVKRLAASTRLGELLRDREAKKLLVAAICAAPAALATHGVFAGRRMTCHPSVKEVVAKHGAHTDDRVVTDGALVTSQGPGSAFEFALALVERLAGATVRADVAAPMMLPAAHA